MNQGLKWYRSITKPRKVNRTIEARRLCRTTPCRQPRGILVGENYQGACNGKKAQPLLERRGNLPRRLFYLVAAAAETTFLIKKTDIGGVVTSPNGPEVGGALGMTPMASRSSISSVWPVTDTALITSP